MPVSSTQLLDDRDRQFADWGETITFRQVTQTYNPGTQQVSEQATDTTITALVGTAPSQPTPGTAAQHLTDRIVVSIKTGDLPGPGPTSTDRIVYSGIEYDVLTFDLSVRNQVYVLECRRTS